MFKKLFIIIILCFVWSCGASTIHKAISRGDMQSVIKFVARGEVNQTDQDLIPGAKTLKAQGVDQDVIDNYYPTYGHTPIIVAAYYGQYDIAQYLCDHGADVNAQARDGSTALIYAAYYNFKDMVDLLLRNGADPTLADHYGRTAQSLTYDESIKNMLAKATAARTQMTAATRADLYPDTPTALSRSLPSEGAGVPPGLSTSGADINAKDRFGRTLLTRALVRGRNDLALELIRQGADINVKDIYDNSALMLASSNDDGDRPFLRTLLEEASADQMAHIRAYREGTTTIHDFMADGWSINDLYDGRIGVLSIDCGADCMAGTSRWTLGGVLFKGPDPDARMIYNNHYRAAMKRYFKGGPVNLDYTYGAPTIPICFLTFEKGVLSAVVFPEANEETGIK